MRGLTVLLLGGLLWGGAPGTAREPGWDREADLRQARTLFRANLDAIRDRDREAYLSCYLDTEDLVRAGFAGVSRGYEDFAASAGEGWPDLFEGRDLQLSPVAPGVVYGTYRYRVRYGPDEQRGISERLFLDTDDGWKIAVTTAFQGPENLPPPPLVLEGATLVDGTGDDPVSDAVVVVRNGRIDCAGARADCPVPEGVERMALAGHWITPGLVDGHVHLSQTGWADGRPDALDVRDRYPYPEVQASLRENPERFFRSYLCSGVTGILDVGGYPWTISRETGLEAPHLAATGSLLSTIDFWLNLPARHQFLYLEDEEAAREGVAALKAAGADAVKVWYIPPRDRTFQEAAEAVRAVGRIADEAGLPLFVHATGLREAKVAVEAGAELLVHSIWDREVDEELVESILRQGTAYCPTLEVGAGYLRLYEAAAKGWAPEVDDPHGCVDPETRARVAETAELGALLPADLDLEARQRRLERESRVADANLVRLAEAGVPIVAGTDAGNPLTFHGPAILSELEAMEAAGMSPSEVLVAATRNGARFLGRGEDLGSLEAGKIADLLVLAEDPTESTSAFRALRQVMRGGVLRSVEELAAPATEPSGSEP
ncbi:MAG: amidohydrolase family protein [Thermoanaerobaculia bacterium]|nr:amidohydrolase family protein [Thermoanaerobaculia bacterium]